MSISDVEQCMVRSFRTFPDLTIPIILRNKNMATMAHMIKSRPVIGLTRSTVTQSGKKLLYLVTSEQRTVAQNRSRILRTFSELRMINFE